MQTNIIVANAKAEFPNDAAKRSQFIEKKLFDNNINPLDALNFSSPMTFKAISQVLDAWDKYCCTDSTIKFKHC